MHPYVKLIQLLVRYHAHTSYVCRHYQAQCECRLAVCNVAAVMEVKEDFYLYRSGVYSYSLPADYTSSAERRRHFHSVSILG